MNIAKNSEKCDIHGGKTEINVINMAEKLREM